MSIPTNAKDCYASRYGGGPLAASPDAPRVGADPVTPSDTTDLPFIGTLFIGGAGDVCVDLADFGTAVVYKNCAAGSIFPRYVKRVRATGTTATSIVLEI